MQSETQNPAPNQGTVHDGGGVFILIQPAGALLHRITHDLNILPMNGESCRPA